MMFFRQTINDGDQLIWKRSFLYRVVYETDESFYLDSEQGEVLALSKINYENIADIFPCEDGVCVVCNHCRYFDAAANACRAEDQSV